MDTQQTRDKIVELVSDLATEDGVETSTTLVDDHILDSLAIISLVADLEDAFDITVPAVEIVAKNFNSVDGLTALVERLVEDQLG